MLRFSFTIQGQIIMHDKTIFRILFIIYIDLHFPRNFELITNFHFPEFPFLSNTHLSESHFAEFFLMQIDVKKIIILIDSNGKKKFTKKEIQENGILENGNSGKWEFEEQRITIGNTKIKFSIKKYKLLLKLVKQ